jgi:DUF4097 and DUF4098 domain-containing protein YvlB
MTFSSNGIWLTGAVLVAIALAGCSIERNSDGGGAGPAVTADRKFSVSGPVRIDLTNGAGTAQVSAGPDGEVQIHAEFRAKSKVFQSGKNQLNEMSENPPITQDGNFIRIGGSSDHAGGMIANYTITVPADSQIRAIASSGTIQVRGIKGPATLIAGSGTITAENIAEDVQATVGSGTLRLSQIQGQVQATSGSGSIQLSETHGDVRAQTGSGNIQITKAGDTVEASSGSGNISVGQVTADVRAHSSSGDVTVEGNPQSDTYWDIRTSSGAVSLHVPPTASFRLYAHSRSGDIDTQIPIMMEGTTGKHELRARIGDGKARVEVETGSGKILLR